MSFHGAFSSLTSDPMFWGFMHGIFCIVAWRNSHSRKQRISVIAIAIITAALSISYFTHKERLRQQQIRSLYPTSVCKRIDSPYPFNEWDHDYLVIKQQLQMVNKITLNTLWFPHHMAIGDQEYQSFAPQHRKHIWTGILPGSDAFVCKTRLAVFARQMSQQVKVYLPESLTVPELPSIDSPTTHGMAYIGKTNEQRQNGVVIFQNRLPKQDELVSSTAILQKLVVNPLLVDGHKVTHRVYVVCWIQEMQPVEIYRYRDGFLYYTSLPYDAQSEDVCCHVASGYNSRALYEKLPLTHQDLYLQQSELKSKIETQLDQSIATVLQGFCDSTRGYIQRDCRGSFQLFGVDVQVTQGGKHAYILEFNKSPNLEVMDERDGRLKQQMSESMWTEVVGPKLRMNFQNAPEEMVHWKQITSNTFI